MATKTSTKTPNIARKTNEKPKHWQRHRNTNQNNRNIDRANRRQGCWEADRHIRLRLPVHRGPRHRTGLHLATHRYPTQRPVTGSAVHDHVSFSETGFFAMHTTPDFVYRYKDSTPTLLRTYTHTPTYTHKHQHTHQHTHTNTNTNAQQHTHTNKNRHTHQHSTFSRP